MFVIDMEAWFCLVSASESYQDRSVVEELEPVSFKLAYARRGSSSR